MISIGLGRLRISTIRDIAVSPAAKFNAILASVVVSFMFLGIAQIAPMLKTLGLPYQFTLPLVGLLTSAGLYRLLALGVRWLMEYSSWVSRKVLGAHYMHGTWIGYFIGHAGDKRFTVEYYVQNLDDLVITGRSFTERLDDHSFWESEAVTIDARKGRLIFTYKMDIISRSASVNGMNTLFFERKSAHHAPSATAGYVHDLNDLTRIAVRTEKLSEKLVAWQYAVDEAQRRFP